MQLSVHLSFDGHCAEAFRFYARVFGGKVVGLMSYGESPMADKVPPEWHARIVHATLEVEGGSIMGADVPPESYVIPQGFAVTLSLADLDRGREVFGALAEGGTVRLPLQKTFWAAGYGLVVDRFGVPWEINCS